MTNLLDTLSDRAERVHPDPDLDSILDAVVVRGRRLAHRRRAAAAGASGAVLLGVGALVAALVTSAQTPSDSTPVATAPRPGPSVASTDSAGTPVRLVPAPATPKTAPVSLGLLPDGWTLSGVSLAYASWTLPGRWYGKYVEPLTGKLTVTVSSSDGKHLHAKDFPLRVARHPATYEINGKDQIVSLYVNPSITVDVDLPSTTRLSRAQALELAGSVTIRDISNPAHG